MMQFLMRYLIFICSIVLVVLGFTADWSNNTASVVHVESLDSLYNIGQFGLRDLGLIGLSAVFAVSVAIFGYAAGISIRFMPFAIVAVFCSSIMTLQSQTGRINDKDHRAAVQSARVPALLAELSTLNESLNPSDGSQPCALQGNWCDSSAKEARVAEINRELAEIERRPATAANADSIETKTFLGSIVIGGPIVNFGLSYLAGWILRFRPKSKKPENNNTMSKRPTRKKQSPQKHKKQSPANNNVVPFNHKKKETVTAEKFDGDRFSGNGDYLEQCREVVTQMIRDGERVSIKTVMSKRNGSQRIVRGRREDIGAYLRILADEGLLIKGKGGYTYEKEAANSRLTKRNF